MLGTKILFRYLGIFEMGKAAFDQSRSLLVKVDGSDWSEGSGVSNKKRGGNPLGRMGKVSCAMFISTGLVGPKMYPNWFTSIGQTVNILLLDKTVIRSVTWKSKESNGWL